MKKRTYCHWLYLSEEEKAILDEKVKLSGMKNANIFLRHLIKYGYVYEVDYSELHENNYQLGKIGNNINQIAAVANKNRYISDHSISEVKGMVEECRDSLIEFISRLTKNRRGDVVRRIGLKGIVKLLHDAEINHCLSFEEVSDEVITTLLKNRITSEDCLNGYILDGYPRNLAQAKKYNELVKTLYETADNPTFEVFTVTGKATIADFSGNPPKSYEL